MSLSEIGSGHSSATKGGQKKTEAGFKSSEGLDSVSGGGAKKEFGGLLSMFGAALSVAKVGKSMVPDFSTKKSDRVEDVSLREVDSRDSKDSRFDVGDRERESRKTEDSRDGDRKEYDSRDKKIHSDEGGEDSRRADGDKDSDRQSDRSSRDKDLEARDKSDRALDRSGDSKDTVAARKSNDKNSDKDSQAGEEKTIATSEGQQSKRSDKYTDSSNNKQEARVVTLSNVEKGTTELDESAMSMLVNVVAALINFLNANDIGGDKDSKDITSLIDRLLTDDQKNALFNALGLILADSKNLNGQEIKQTLTSSSSLNDLAKNLGNLLSGDQLRDLKSAIANLSNGNTQGLDAKNNGNQTLLDLNGRAIDIETLSSQGMERLRNALSKILSDYKGNGEVQNGMKNDLGVKLDFQKAKIGSEGVMRVNLIDSESLAHLQSQGAKLQDNIDLDVPRDLLLRAQKTFSETDSGKMERAIVKSTDNALSQVNAGVLNANALRGLQSEKSMQRFSSDPSLKAGSSNVDGKSIKVNVQDAKVALNDLLRAGNSEQRGSTQRGSENAQGKFDGSPILGGISNPKTDKATEIAKNQTNQNRANMYSVREQVRVNIQKAVDSGQDRIRLQLRPQELGRLDVRIAISKDGTVVAKVFVERKETLDLLRNDVRSLLNALNDSGLKADSDSLEFSLQGGAHEQSQKGKKKSFDPKGEPIDAIGDEATIADSSKVDDGTRLSDAKEDELKENDDTLDIVV